MNVFYVKEGLFALAAGFAAAVMLVHPNIGLAQAVPEESRPMLLTPPINLDRPKTATAIIPSPALEPEFKVLGGIKVDTLSTVDLASVGTLTAETGGLGVNTWLGTPRGLVDFLLPILPVRTNSRAMHDLERRLLLSSAITPEGASAANLITARAERLMEMGETTTLFEFLNVVPHELRDAQLARVETEARFVTNDQLRACKIAVGQSDALTDPYWQRVYIFCQILAGDKEPAALGASLLRETGYGSVAFFHLADALASGTKVELKSLGNPTPLLLAMAQAAKAMLPNDVLGTDSPSMLRAIATSNNASFNIRLDAAERAEGMGALSTETLRELYALAIFSEEELANPLSRAEVETGPLSRALLYRTAIANTVPSARAAAASYALQLAQRGGRYPSVARAFLSIIADLQPSAELSWFAPVAVRALLVSGQADAAHGWLSLIRAGALIDDEKKAQLMPLLPFVLLAGPSHPGTWTAGDLLDWWRTESDDLDARARATFLFLALEGLGETVPDELWFDLLGGSERAPVVMPSAALWYRLQKATAAGRVGETVLLSLLALGNGGTAQASPMVLRAVIDALSGVGQAPAARALVMEAALAAGL